MFGKQMTALQTRKKALLLESDLNRLRLRAELNDLREAADIPKKLKHLVRFGSLAPVLAPLASIIGTFVLRRTSVAGGVLRKAMVAAPAFVRLWRTVSAMFAEFK